MTDKPIIKAQTLTDIMLIVFRLNRRLLDRGDDLVKTLGLNSVRWQLLGAVALTGKPLSAPQIADTMGITRQGAQKQLNKMIAEGFFESHPNPRHERSPLYSLTKKGERTFAEAMMREKKWVKNLSKELAPNDLICTLNLLKQLHQKLDLLDPLGEIKS